MEIITTLISKTSIKHIVCGAVALYGVRVAFSPSIKTVILEDIIRFSLKLDCKQFAFKMQMRLSRQQLHIESPSVWRNDLLKARGIFGARVPDSKVLCFYNGIYRKHLGLTSSWLSQGEGKTLSCLQVLSDIEKEEPGAAFLLVRVQNQSIELALRSALRIHPDIRVADIVQSLTLIGPNLPADPPKIVYGLLDQVEKWHPTDKGVLRCLVNQQHENLRIHMPCRRSDVALHLDDVNGKVKANYMGSAGSDE